MKLQQVLEKTTQFFKDKEFPTARLDAEILLAHALGFKRIDLYINFDKPLSEQELSGCRELVRQRATGLPIAYILGKKDFYNLTFQVGPGVLVPRPETEHIVETVLQETLPEQEFSVLDLGAGSGCIPIAILKNRPNSRGVAIEKSPEAFGFLEKNVSFHELGERMEVRHQSVESFGESAAFDFVTANPPYIDATDKSVDRFVRAHEPHLALFAGDQGLAEIKVWGRVAREALRPGGRMLFEIGSSQGPVVRDFFSGELDLQDVRVLKDLAGLDRIVIGRKKA